MKDENAKSTTDVEIHCDEQYPFFRVFPATHPVWPGDVRINVSQTTLRRWERTATQFQRMQDELKAYYNSRYGKSV